MSTYKIIKRRYFETHSIFEQSKVGLFIARGQWADNHLAYSRVDENGDTIDECSYVQIRGHLKSGERLYMQRV